MLLTVAIFHLVLAVLLIALVLLQDSKGGGALGIGGGSNQVLSSTGAANFLVKTTRWVAILFACTCLGLTYLSTKRSGSVTDQFSAPAAAPVETAPAGVAPTDATTTAPAEKTETPATTEQKK